MKIKERDSSVIPKSKTPKALPTHEEIEVRAYEIYVDRGSADGQDVEDWLQAEAELLEVFDEEPDRKAKAKTA